MPKIIGKSLLLRPPAKIGNEYLIMILVDSAVSEGVSPLDHASESLLEPLPFFPRENSSVVSDAKNEGALTLKRTPIRLQQPLFHLILERAKQWVKVVGNNLHALLLNAKRRNHDMAPVGHRLSDVGEPKLGISDSRGAEVKRELDSAHSSFLANVSGQPRAEDGL